MLINNMNYEDISKITKASINDIKNIGKEISKNN